MPFRPMRLPRLRKFHTREVVGYEDQAILFGDARTGSVGEASEFTAVGIRTPSNPRDSAQLKRSERSVDA